MRYGYDPALHQDMVAAGKMQLYMMFVPVTEGEVATLHEFVGLVTFLGEQGHVKDGGYDAQFGLPSVLKEVGVCKIHLHLVPEEEEFA